MLLPLIYVMAAQEQTLGSHALKNGFLWVALAPGEEERAEALEQLRPLAHGFTIGVAILAGSVPHGIDTEDDLRLAEARR